MISLEGSSNVYILAALNVYSFTRTETNMKTSRLFYGLLLMTMTLSFVSCSDDEEFPLNGKWSLLVKNGGIPSEEINFKLGDIICLITGNTLTVSHNNPEDVTFLPDGLYSVENIGDRSFQINGKYYEYTIKGRQLTIFKDVAADGFIYVFIEIKGI